VIEEELRSLLTERAEAVPDNPGRAVELRSRIGVLRRRRVTGAALGLVLLALAGLAVLRLPGTNESLPPGVPAPPYFDGFDARVAGYTNAVGPMHLDRPSERLVSAELSRDFRYLIVVRCARRGVLTFRNLVNDQSREVDCTQPVGDHFEGAAAIDPAAARTLLETGSEASNVRFEPGAAGQEAGLLMSIAAGRLRPWSDPKSRPLAQGADTTVEIAIPGYRGTEPDGTDSLDLLVECVAGVRIEFSVPAGPLGTADCDPLAGTMIHSMVTVGVTRAELDRLGLRTGQRVPLTIRSVGRDTDQWRVFPIN
jgi:hypothetical protein